MRDSVSVFSVGLGGALSQVPGSPFPDAGPSGSSNFPDSVAFSPSGGLLATANDSQSSVSVFSVAQGGALSQVPGSPFHTDEGPGSVTFSPDGGLLATVSYSDDTVSVFSVAQDGALSQVSGSPFATSPGPSSIAFSANGNLLAIANYFEGSNYSAGTVSVFSVAQDGALSQVTGSPFATGVGPDSVAFSPDGGLLATANYFDGTTDGTVSVFAVAQDGELSQVSESPFATGGGPSSVAFSSSGGLLADTNAGDSTVSVFSVGQGGVLSDVSGSPFATGGGQGSVAFRPGAAVPTFAVSTASTGLSLFSPTPPVAQIDAPASAGTYSLRELVTDSFSCADSAFGSGIASCTDSNGGIGAGGTLDTSSIGAHTYTVTATSTDGQVGTASISYTVAAAPGAQIGSPLTGGTFALGESVVTSFSCADGAYGPGIALCVDSNARSGGSGTLDTSSPGPHTYTLSAASIDGQTTSASIHYTVIAPPDAHISSPADNRTVSLGQSVATVFSCTEGTGGPGIASCTDSDGLSTGAGHLDTSAYGRHSYAVIAISSDGQQATTTISYLVQTPPPPSGAVGVSIDNGDFATNDPHVHLDIVWPEGATSAFVSNNGGFGPTGHAAALALSAQVPWTLEQTGVYNVPVTVYLRFLGARIDYVNFTADIILDATPPALQSAQLLPLGQMSELAALARGKARSYAIKIKARDPIAGICKIEASNTRANGSTVSVTRCREKGITHLARTVRIRSTAKPRYIRVRNSAGSWSRWRTVKS